MKKSILFIVNNFNIGGPQKSLLSLLYYLQENYEVDLLILNGENGLGKYLPPNVNIISSSKEIPLLMLNRNTVKKNVVKNFRKHFLLSIKVYGFLLKNILKKNLTQEKQKFWVGNKDYLKQFNIEPYDYAIAVSGGHSLMYLVDSVYAHKKIGWVRTEYQNLKRNNKIDEHYFEKVDLILSVSNQCTETFVKMFPSQSLKVKTFFNPLPYLMYDKIFNNDEKYVHESSESLCISTISRLDKDKGFDLLIDAAIKLKEDNYDFKWNIYGVGPLWSYIDKEIARYKLEEFIELKGFEFNTGKVLRGTDILVHPSRFEGKSNTIDEAKFYGVPIVSTNFPTVKEQLHHEKTAIITDISAESLYLGIKEMIENKNLKKSIVENLKNETKYERDVYSEFQAILEEV